jgi:ABC-type sugar transport system ATPase subunit
MSHQTGDIELAQVIKRYAGKRVLDGVSLTVPAGTVHALVGANGAGKSTLGKVIAGVIRPDEGIIRFGGSEVHWKDPSEARRAGIALIAQELAVAPELSVMENVFLGIEPRRMGFVARGQLQRRFDELIERWGLELPRDVLVGRLRLADQQKVEILRAVASEAKVIVMDEPTSSLTHVETAILHRMIDDLRRRGCTVIYVSHFLDAVLEVADKVSVLRNGVLIATTPVAGLSEEELVTQMFGAATPQAQSRRRSRVCAPAVLEVEGITRGTVLRRVTLKVEAGEVVGLAGLVGSGRSELVRAIFGVDRLDAGMVKVAGKPVRAHAPREAIRAGMALVPESRKDDGLFLDLSLGANMSFAILDKLARAMGLLRRQDERELARSMMERLSIVARGPEAKAGSLSGGNQQKLLFAKWMLRRPVVLLLDEPTRGVDVNARAAIHALIRGLAEEGVGVLLVSSEFEELVALSDRMLILREGTIIAQLPGGTPVETVMQAAFGMGVAKGRGVG